LIDSLIQARSCQLGFAWILYEFKDVELAELLHKISPDFEF